MTRPNQSANHATRSLITACYAAIVMAAVGMAPAMAQSASAVTKPSIRRELTKIEIVERLKQSTCHIMCPRVGTGTGWGVDAKRRLIITNHHVIAGPVTRIHVYFPVKRNGKWINNLSDYLAFVPASNGTTSARKRRSRKRMPPSSSRIEGHL